MSCLVTRRTLHGNNQPGHDCVRETFVIRALLERMLLSLTKLENLVAASCGE